MVQGLPQGQENILARLQGVAEAHILLLAPDAPEAVQDESIIRMASYLYDTPAVGRRDSYANSFVNSGAGALLTFWTPQGFRGKCRNCRDSFDRRAKHRCGPGPDK